MYDMMQLLNEPFFFVDDELIAILIQNNMMTWHNDVAVFYCAIIAPSTVKLFFLTMIIEYWLIN